MNQLSQLLYWADVAPNVATSLAVLFGFLCFFSFIVSGILTGFWVSARSEKYSEEEVKPITTLMKWTWPIFAISLICGQLMNFVPSKETIYAIAASEVAEDVIKTPEGQRARNILNKAMDKLEKELTKEPKEPEE